MVQKGPDGPKMGPKWSKIFRLTILVPFGPFLDHFGVLTSLPCLALFGPKWTIFRPSPVMKGRPQSEKKGSSSCLLCVGCLWNPKSCALEHKYGRNQWKMSKMGQNSMKKMDRFLPLSCHEWQVMGPKEVFNSYLVPEMNLVKVSWKLNARKCQTNLPSLLWLAEWKAPAPFKCSVMCASFALTL